MPASNRTPGPSPAPIPVAPTEEVWRTMGPDERERFLLAVNEALSDPQRLMTEGRPHKRAKSRAADVLSLYFKTSGRLVYVAEEMAAVYPGLETFSPDVLAVLDVEQPDDDDRMAWVVADEGRGLDFVLEVLHRGDRKKDLVDNVERYASLGITEYFIYDWGKQQLYGYRLMSPDARRYQRLVPQNGLYHSEVLGVELILREGSLHFYEGGIELFGAGELLDRLTVIVGSLEEKAEQAEAKAEQAAKKAEQAAKKAEQAEAKIEQAAKKAERAEAKIEDALATSRENVLAILAARMIPCTDDIRNRVLLCDDLGLLQRWLVRTLSATSAAEVFEPTAK